MTITELPAEPVNRVKLTNQDKNLEVVSKNQKAFFAKLNYLAKKAF